MSVLAQRFVFGTLLLGFAGAALGYDLWQASTHGLTLLLVGLGTVAWWEFGVIVGVGRVARLVGSVVLILGLLREQAWLTAANAGTATTLLAMLLLWPGLLALGALMAPPSRERFGRLALATLGMLYLAGPLACCLHLRYLPGGAWWVLFLLLVVKGNDIGAFLVGRWCGRTPLSAISPKKTVEGALGGLALGLVVAGLFAPVAELNTSVIGLLGVGLAAGLAGQLGDLAESLLKRSYGVKDSAALVPAFGGVLDLLDSVLFAAPVLLLLVR